MEEWITLTERRALAATRVTVDGAPAAIGGTRNGRFANVIRLSDGASWEWAWPTVRRIVARDGAFRL